MSEIFNEQTPNDNMDILFYVFLGSAVVALVTWLVCQNRNRQRQSSDTPLRPTTNNNPQCVQTMVEL